MALNRLLLVEDDAGLVDGLQYALEKNGFTLDVVNTVREAKMLLAQEDPCDLLLLDVTLPDGTGFEICDALRKKNSRIPVLFLTAADEETSIIRGLDSGGDDYVTKPFRVGELCSRIRALLRRSGMEQEQNGEVLESKDVRIDLLCCRAYRNGQALELTAVEYRLLCLLVQNAGRILTREAILDALWDGNGNYVDDNTLSVYIRRLREKVEEDPSRPDHLLTVRGFGYQWRD